MITDSIGYTQLADRRVIEVFDQSSLPLPEAEKLFSHVLNSQHVWMKRILSEPEEYKIWQLHERSVFEKIHLENFLLIGQALEIDREQNITYLNSKGEEFTSRLKDILFHVVNHSTYHRAQIATLFRTAGITPPVTDYIMLKREGLI